MGRRTVLLIVAALIAALGTSLVFLYVRGVDARAASQYDAVKVLTAVEQIPAGETMAAAQAAGKIELATVTKGALLEGHTTSTEGLDEQVALTTVYPGEQIITGKFGEAGEQDVLSIPDGQLAISVNLSDPARVAGFVTPGAEVAIFMSATPNQEDPAATAEPSEEDAAPAAEAYTRLLLPRVQVIGVGTTTVTQKTTTDETGAQTTEPLPRTLLTLSLDQADAEKVLFAARTGELAFALLTEKSEVEASAGVTVDDIFDGS